MTVDLRCLLELAKKIVRQCSHVAKKAQNDLQVSSIITKEDTSPVTVIDFAVQASITIYLERKLSPIPFRLIAEEGPEYLREESSNEILGLVVYYVRLILDDSSITSELVLDTLDKGHYDGNISNEYWILDPIDGTAGFVRNGQYAIGLSFVQSGMPVLACVGCPNLPFLCINATEFNFHQNVPSVGCMIASMKGDNCIAYDLFSEQSRVLSVPDCPSLCPYGVITSRMKMTEECGVSSRVLYMDSMCKYVCIAMGIASIYMRECHLDSYKESVWDHCAGYVIIQSAGGVVTDLNGKDLDFTHGHKLTENHGIVVSTNDIHSIILKYSGYLSK